MLYQNYIAEALKIVTENTAKVGGGSYLTKHWDEIIHPKPEETRTPEEIIDMMKKKLEKLGGT